jgi:hypothetical protein
VVSLFDEIAIIEFHLLLHAALSWDLSTLIPRHLKEFHFPQSLEVDAMSRHKLSVFFGPRAFEEFLRLRMSTLC